MTIDRDAPMLWWLSKEEMAAALQSYLPQPELWSDEYVYRLMLWIDQKAQKDHLALIARDDASVH